MSGPAPTGCRIHGAEALSIVRRDRTGKKRTRCRICQADWQDAHRTRAAVPRYFGANAKRGLTPLSAPAASRYTSSAPLQ
jgi:hypothetical protein